MAWHCTLNSVFTFSSSLIHPEVLSHQFGTLPDIIPLEFCGSKRKRKKEKRGSKHSDDGLGLSNKSRKIKKKASQSPGLEKLKKKRKRILSTLSTLSPSPREAEASSSSSGTTATVSSSAISGALSNASNRSTLTHDFLPLAQAGPSTSSAVWTNFNQPHVLNYLNFPRFINTQNSQGLIFNQPPPGTITAQTVYNVPPPVRPPVRQTSRPQLNDNNVYNPATSNGERTGLRPIVIDGSNVAFEYLKNPLTGLRFNSKGIEVSNKSPQRCQSHFWNSIPFIPHVILLMKVIQYFYCHIDSELYNYKTMYQKKKKI